MGTTRATPPIIRRRSSLLPWLLRITGRPPQGSGQSVLRDVGNRSDPGPGTVQQGGTYGQIGRSGRPVRSNGQVKRSGQSGQTARPARSNGQVGVGTTEAAEPGW